MNKYYKVRPYYGFDCDSVNGFNNGYYLDTIVIEATDEIQAMIRAMAYWRRQDGNYAELKRLKAHNTWFTDCGFYIETGYYDRDGNELTETEYSDVEDHDEAETSYRYEYITFDHIEEVSDET